MTIITFQRMVTHHPQDGHPTSTGWSNTITHYQNDGHPPSPECSPTVLRMGTHHPNKGHLPSQGQSPPSKGGSPTFKSRVTHHPQDGHWGGWVWRGQHIKEAAKLCHTLTFHFAQLCISQSFGPGWAVPHSDFLIDPKNIKTKKFVGQKLYELYSLHAA